MRDHIYKHVHVIQPYLRCSYVFAGANSELNTTEGGGGGGLKYFVHLTFTPRSEVLDFFETNVTECGMPWISGWNYLHFSLLEL